MGKVFIICPVRGMNEKERSHLETYVTALEKDGHVVHYPPRDTDQGDPVGLDICSQNKRALLEADEVHVYWNASSEGSKFDMGMAFAADKPIHIINKEDVQKTEGKSINNVVLALDRTHVVATDKIE